MNQNLGSLNGQAQFKHSYSSYRNLFGLLLPIFLNQVEVGK